MLNVIQISLPCVKVVLILATVVPSIAKEGQLITTVTVTCTSPQWD